LPNKKGVREVLILQSDDEEKFKFEYSAGAIKEGIKEGELI
jgi:malate/lactate dehydrogenase